MSKTAKIEVRVDPLLKETVVKSVGKGNVSNYVESLIKKDLKSTNK